MATSAKTKPISNSQRWVRAFILVVGTFVFLCFLLADPLLRHYRKDDFKDAPPQEGVATVVTRVMPPANVLGDTRGDQQRPLVTVRFRNGVYNAARTPDAQRLQIDKPALIGYRVGKSGRIVVDYVAPLPDTLAPPSK
jgi:hypothetical protein